MPACLSWALAEHARRERYPDAVDKARVDHATGSDVDLASA